METSGEVEEVRDFATITTKDRSVPGDKLTNRAYGAFTLEITGT
jgi:hypothetical protein